VIGVSSPPRGRPPSASGPIIEAEYEQIEDQDPAQADMPPPAGDWSRPR
jgi:hypothetical protein